jgi:hypothetical protein
MSYTKDLQAKLVQYETIAEVEHEKRTAMEEAFDHLDETIKRKTEQMTASGWSPTPHPKEVMWQNLINFSFDGNAGNVAHWTTHRQPNTAPMARRVPRRRR